MRKSTSSKRFGSRKLPRLLRWGKGKQRVFDSTDMEIPSDACSVDTLNSSSQEDPVMIDAMETRLSSSAESQGTDLNPMMARLDALQTQQQLQGMNHPDVLFALRHMARAHRRRGEIKLSLLIEQMIQN